MIFCVVEFAFSSYSFWKRISSAEETLSSKERVAKG